MSRVCAFTGRRTEVGNTYTLRGKAKYLGGVGTKVTGKTRRKFKPNIHTVTAVVDGSIKRVKVSTKAIRMGLVVKPLKRKYAYKPDAPAEAAAE
ncbi:MAG: 50S ribosomal protein L28 [Phycisphaeraceae bacterium]